MKKVLLATCAMVSLVAMPAFAAVQNIKVGGNIDSTYVYRDRFDLRGRNGAGGAQQFEQSLFITQTQVRIDADLSESVRTVVQIINERAWGEENSVSGAEDIDINLAYVELREILESPVTADIGRQQLNYGNAFIIGANGPNNVASNGGIDGVAEDLTKRTALDAVKLIFDYNPLTIDVFAAKVDSNDLAGWSSGGGIDYDDDVDLYGVNANYSLNDEMNTTLEAYFFTKFDRSDNSLSTGGAKTDSVYVPGLRASTNPIKGLNLQIEAALQRGNKATTHTAGTARADNLQREAFGGQAVINYQLPIDQMAPVAQFVYTYVSGDSNPGDARYANQASENVWTAWDPMFEDQASGTIYNALFDLTNAHIATLSGQVTPIEDVTAKLSWTGLWLAKEADTGGAGNNSAGGVYQFFMRQPDGTVSTPIVTNNREVGTEIDADLTYDYTEDVQLGLSLGWFFPGNFFDSANNENAKQALANASVNF